jgi:hypothetical protein
MVDISSLSAVKTLFEVEISFYTESWSVSDGLFPGQPADLPESSIDANFERADTG